MTSAATIALLADPQETSSLGDLNIQRMLRQGISIAAIAAPWAVRCGHVLFETDGHRYRPNPIGEFALVFGVLADLSNTMGDLNALDIVAWAPKSGRIGTRLGRAFALGEDQIGVDGMGTTGLPLVVHRTPLGWLKANRRGIVVADWEIAGVALRGMILEAKNDAHRRELVSKLTAAPPTIVVSSRRLAA